MQRAVVKQPIPVKSAVVPEDSLVQVTPLLVVARIVPASPTAMQLLAFPGVHVIALRVFVVPEFWLNQISGPLPLASPYRIVPRSPTAWQVSAVPDKKQLIARSALV